MISHVNQWNFFWFIRQIYIPTLLMDKKCFAEFSNYLEGLIQTIFFHASLIPEISSMMKRHRCWEDFLSLHLFSQKVNQDRFPSLKTRWPLRSTKKDEKATFNVENSIKRNTPKECVDSVNLQSKAIGSTRKEVLFTPFCKVICFQIRKILCLWFIMSCDTAEQHQHHKVLCFLPDEIS